MIYLLLIIKFKLMTTLNKKKYHKKCIHEGCIKHPNFNLHTEKNGKYCFDHKLENMTHAC